VKKKLLILLTTILISNCSGSPQLDDISAQKWNTCIYWLEEYFVINYQYSSEVSILLAGLNLSTEETYQYDFDDTDFSEFYLDLLNYDPTANYVCDFWYDIMQ
tara:strand:- start:83 stop:391 length:309 start_codon:yes stop_codon:yes gene_type:complete